MENSELLRKLANAENFYIGIDNRFMSNSLQLNYYENINNKKSAYFDIFVWVYEHRNGDGIYVIISKERPDVNGKFNEKAWASARCFDWDGEHGAAEYIVSTLVDMYEAGLGPNKSQVLF